MSATETAETAFAADAASPRRRRLLPVLIGAAVLGVLGLWLASGIFVVEADERAVVRLFGAPTAEAGPGIHYRLPPPLTRLDVVKATAITKVGAGFLLKEGEATAGVPLLTGDTNILSIALALQYVVRDPADFLFRIADPNDVVGALAQSALTEAVLGMAVDDVLTTGRLKIQERVKRVVQERLDRDRSGIQIASANIMTIALDAPVAASFQEVADARADREKIINEAHAYANTVVPKARGEARGQIGEALGYKQRRIAEALGEAGRFEAILGEYERAPDITRIRLYLESMERVLPRAKLHMIDSQGGRLPLKLMIGPSER